LGEEGKVALEGISEEEIGGETVSGEVEDGEGGTGVDDFDGELA
jgi:hypothetical protein